MNKVARPRFSSAEAALRFYFRASEFLEATANGPLRIPRQIPAWLQAGQGVFEDYVAVGSNLCQLDDFQMWLMCELYGPTCFQARQRTLKSALRIAQVRFPRRRITRRGIGLARRSTVQMLRCRLVVIGLIPAVGGKCAGPGIPMGNPASERQGRIPMDQ
jgi:hypothetical protein